MVSWNMMVDSIRKVSRFQDIAESSKHLLVEDMEDEGAEDHDKYFNSLRTKRDRNLSPQVQ